MGFFSKVRTIAMTVANELADKQIDMMSPAIVRQTVRDIEDALEHMRADAAAQAGQVRTLSREVAMLTTKINDDKAIIAKLLAGTAANKEDLAKIRAQEVITLQKQLDAAEQSLNAQKLASANYDVALAKIETKHQQLVSQLKVLERLDSDSKAKEHAANSAAQIDKILGSGIGNSVDDLQEKMRQRNDISSEKFDRAMGSLSTSSESSIDNDDVAALLASLAPSSTVSA